MRRYLVLNPWPELGRDKVLDSEVAVHIQAEVLIALAQVCSTRGDPSWEGSIDPASLMEP